MSFDEVSRYVTSELAYVLEIERAQVELANTGETQQIALRVTTIFRREGAEWKIAHRHADPLMSARPVSAIVEE
jgi:ketosteroid isomerase-like protein